MALRLHARLDAGATACFRQMKVILVADDTAAGRELVRTMLERYGYDVIEATEGFHALRVARELQPDLIILDLNMSGMDGFQVIEELRRDSAFAETPVIALAANIGNEDLRRATAAGFTGYISKPIGSRELRAEVERLLR